MRAPVTAVLLLALLGAASAHTLMNETRAEIMKQSAGDPYMFKIDEVEAEAQAKWTMFKQCDPSWKNNQLGTCSLTICAAGCAMSSVAMMLATKGVSTNPAALNDWLKGHGGYVSGCDIIWGSVDAFGKTSFQGMENAPYASVCSGVAAGHGVIINVRGGAHWVLVTGCDGGSSYLVNDPGFNQASYPADQVLTMAVYH